MKKIACITLIMLLLSACGTREVKIPKEVTELMDNSNLPYELLTKYEDFDKEELEKYKFLDNYMSFDFYFPDFDFNSPYPDEHTLILRFYGFPNDEADYRLCAITVLDSQYDVFGLRVGNKYNSFEEFDEIMERNNYEALGGYYISQYRNGKVRIELWYDIDLVLNSIEISISSKYLGNRTY